MIPRIITTALALSTPALAVQPREESPVQTSLPGATSTAETSAWESAAPSSSMMDESVASPSSVPMSSAVARGDFAGTNITDTHPGLDPETNPVIKSSTMATVSTTGTEYVKGGRYYFNISVPVTCPMLRGSGFVTRFGDTLPNGDGFVSGMRGEGNSSRLFVNGTEGKDGCYGVKTWTAGVFFHGADYEAAEGVATLNLKGLTVSENGDGLFSAGQAIPWAETHSVLCTKKERTPMYSADITAGVFTNATTPDAVGITTVQFVTDGTLNPALNWTATSASQSLRGVGGQADMPYPEAVLRADGSVTIPIPDGTTFFAVNGTLGPTYTGQPIITITPVIQYGVDASLAGLSFYNDWVIPGNYLFWAPTDHQGDGHTLTIATNGKEGRDEVLGLTSITFYSLGARDTTQGAGAGGASLASSAGASTAQTKVAAETHNSESPSATGAGAVQPAAAKGDDDVGSAAPTSAAADGDKSAPPGRSKDNARGGSPVSAAGSVAITLVILSVLAGAAAGGIWFFRRRRTESYRTLHGDGEKSELDLAMWPDQRRPCSWWSARPRARESLSSWISVSFGPNESTTSLEISVPPATAPLRIRKASVTCPSTPEIQPGAVSLVQYPEAARRPYFSDQLSRTSSLLEYRDVEDRDEKGQWVAR